MLRPHRRATSALRSRPGPAVRPRRSRRPGYRPGTEPLEARALLSVTAITGPWVATDPVNPSTTVLLKFTAGMPATAESSALSAVGGRVVTTYPNGPEVVALPPWADVAADLTRLKGEAWVAYAESDATFHASGIVTPTNPLYPQQWGPAFVELPQAWSITEGTPATTVALLDTGIDLSNPSFAGRLWVNPTASTARRTVYGWNFVANSGNAQDDNGHGTHVAGILGASGNSGLVAGVDWYTKLMPLKVLDSSGNGATDTAVSAIYYAVQNGAKVINASWGGDVFSQSMLDALNYADAHGVVFVTAAGNDSSNNDALATYPASFRTPNELVVAALDRSGALASYSNYGATTVDIAAPGTDIVSTVPHGSAYYSGTSMATPYVAGTVALLSGLHPNLNAEQLTAMIRATARPLPSLSGLTISGGVVDAYYALTNHVTSGVSGTSTSGSTPEGVEAAILGSDGMYNAIGATPQAFVGLMFTTLLGRPADAGGVAYFANALSAGMSRSQLIGIVQNTTEARQTRVARWYVDELGWSQTIAALKADPTVNFWAGLLASGWTDSALQAFLLGSDGAVAAAGSTQAWVISAYAGLFGQSPDWGGLVYFTNAVQSGFSPTALIQLLLNTQEGRLTTVARFLRNEYGSTDTLETLRSNAGVVYWAGYLGG